MAGKKKLYSAETEQMMGAAEAALINYAEDRTTRRIALAASRLACWTEAAASANIEGEAGTAEDIGRRRLIARGKSLSDHFTPCSNTETALNLAIAEPRWALTQDGIKALHSVAMEGLLKPESIGRWRKNEADIVDAKEQVVMEGAAAREIPSLMQAWEERFSKPLPGDTVRTAARAHLMFETIHPFSDGNGRVGRAIVAAVHGAADYPALPLSKILAENRSDYYTSLNTSQKNFESEPYVRFHAEATWHSVRHARELARESENAIERLKAAGLGRSSAHWMASRPLVEDADLAWIIGREMRTDEKAGRRTVEMLQAKGALMRTQDGLLYEPGLLTALRKPYRFMEAHQAAAKVRVGTTSPLRDTAATL